MSRKNLVKKLIAIVGPDEESKAPVIEAFASQVKKTLTYRGHVLSILEESTNRKMSSPFAADFVVESHHIRRFFNKLQLGVHSVQNFLGKVLKTPEETIDYFFNTIGKKAYGDDWLVKETVKLFGNEAEGLYLITDLTLDEAKKLKSVLGSSLALVMAAETTEEKVDFLVKPQSKSAIKRITIQAIDKLTQTENRRNTNDRPITEPQLQS